MDKEFKKKSIGGGFITVAGQMIIAGLGLVSTMVLARLVDPEHFGLIGMVASITGILTVLRDAGLSTVTIQREEISNQQVSNLFWINGGLGIGMAVITAAFAPVVAWFYHEPRLVGITLVYSLISVFSGLTAQHQALLRRSMRFAHLTIVDMLSLVVGFLVGWQMAVRGFGYWAIVTMMVVQNLVSMIAIWIAMPWMPDRFRKTEGMKAMLQFGGYQSGTSLASYLFRNVDNILIGFFCGAGPLGIYTRAYALLLLPINQLNGPIGGVAIPTLSRLQQDPPRFRRYFLGAYSVLAACVFPVITCFVVFADDIIHIMLGYGWDDAATIFRYLAPATIIGALLYPTGWIFTAMGRPERLFKSCLAWSALSLTGFATGIPFGVNGVAISYSVVSLLGVIPICCYAIVGTEITLRDLFSTIYPPFLSALAAGAAGICFYHFVPDTLWTVYRAGIGSCLVGGIYLLLLTIVFKQLDFYLEILQTLFPKLSRIRFGRFGKAPIPADKNIVMRANLPKISIGLPVYNGDKYLRNSIDSILRQSFTDFELIICDNASTDETENICREYARKDARVRYHRNETNIGLNANHNLAFALSRAEYFKWAAHDDECLPDLVGHCLSMLEQAPPQVLLAYPQTAIIDAGGNVMEEYKVSIETKELHPHQRLKKLLKNVHLGTPMYGVMRSSALRKTTLMKAKYSPDYVFFAELAMLGEIWEVPEVLLRKRFHPGRSVEMNSGDLMKWLNPKAVKSWLSSGDVLALDYCKAALRLPLNPVDKLICAASGPIAHYRRDDSGRIWRWKNRFRRLVGLSPVME